MSGRAFILRYKIRRNLASVVALYTWYTPESIYIFSDIRHAKGTKNNSEYYCDSFA